MVIDKNNCNIGNKAMASVLLLYYHLLDDGGFTNDQTVYIDPDDFDGFSYLDVTVIENEMILSIDGSLLREGAVIYLLCELNDMVGEYEDDFLSQELTKKVIDSLSSRKINDVPEVNSLLALLKSGESMLNYPKYSMILEGIYQNYVYSRFKGFLE